MKCKTCRKEIPNEHIYCGFCGKKQIRQSKKRKKRPKGTGTITCVAGLAKPFMARLPSIGKGKRCKQPLLGYFATYEEADLALYAEIKKGRIDKAGMTLKDLWSQFSSGEYFDSLSSAGQGNHRAAWNYLNPIGGIKVSAIATDTFQSVVRGMSYTKKVKIPGSPADNPEYENIEITHKRASKLKVRNLASLLCKEAMGLGIMLVNYGALVKLPKDDTEETLSFPPSILKLLFEKRESEVARIVLCYCFTGMRPGEIFLLNVEDIHLGPPDYCIGGIKTEAGRNRIIPIPPLVKPFFQQAINGRSKGPLFVNAAGGHYDLNNWRKREFVPFLEANNIDSGYTPNSGRHTFYTMNRRRKEVSPEIMMEIMGHEDYATGMENYNHWTEDDILEIYNAIAGLTLPA
ncbi:site-specific integrase [Clostridia bacterium OttesenSCG-928-O13]|nr:site-specific integrase [Clostridia bacterium OttesenSCG-928-O13]